MILPGHVRLSAETRCVQAFRAPALNPPLKCLKTFSNDSSALYFTFTGYHKTQFSVHANIAKCLSNACGFQLFSEQPEQALEGNPMIQKKKK